MPPADKLLSPSILAALGLAACAGVSPCLQYAPTKTGETGLDGGDSDTDADTDSDTDTDTDADTDADADTDTDADSDTDTDADTDTGTTETGGSGTTIGPCLSPPYDTGGSGPDTGTVGTDTGAPPVPAGAVIFERLKLDQVLPSDVLERIERKSR